MKIPAFALACLFCASAAWAADEKIDPASYICAELVASSVSGQPPLYEALQLDGFNSAKTGNPVADPANLAEMLIIVSDSCAAKPTDKAVEHWARARKSIPADTSGSWRADKTTCGDYTANPDDGSGFIIWLDAWQRAKSGKKASVLTDQATLDHFLEVCASSPQRLLKDVMADTAK